MARRINNSTTTLSELPKARTGIFGLDDITNGGLPQGRPTLVCGSAGSGKTLFGMEFLVRGATQFDEPGVFMSFEETEKDLTENVASLGFDLADLVARKKLAMDWVYIERRDIEETGEYDLEGLFIRLGHAIDSVKAKRVVLDTIESLFAGLSNTGILRSELRRLFRWLKDKGVTAVITAERGDGILTRHGLEEYVSDCVILLDNRVDQELSTRRMRIIKYRGSSHGGNEYPFVIDDRGFSVLPITSLMLEHPASQERVSTGVAGLDEMMGGKGVYRGTSIMVSGMAGSGKSSISAQFVDAGCRRGERCLYLASEESPQQIMRNMRSIGIDLKQWVDKGLLRFHSARATFQGLEMHLVVMQRIAAEFKPRLAVIDAMSDFASMGTELEVRFMLTRILDYFKSQQITAIFTTLVATTEGDAATSSTHTSSLFDTWVHLLNVETSLERNRALFLIKSRGMAHSNQLREFMLTDRGIVLREVYAGAAGALMGVARTVQEEADRTEGLARQQELERLKRKIDNRKQAVEAQIKSIRAQFQAESAEIDHEIDAVRRRGKFMEADAAARARARSGAADNRKGKA